MFPTKRQAGERCAYRTACPVENKRRQKQRFGLISAALQAVLDTLKKVQESCEQIGLLYLKLLLADQMCFTDDPL